MLFLTAISQSPGLEVQDRIDLEVLMKTPCQPTKFSSEEFSS